MREQCSSRAIAPDHWVIPLPCPRTVAMLENTNRNATPFLRAAGIKQGSEQHKELLRTVRALHRQYLDPFKYVEEQAPDRVDRLIEKARSSLPWLEKYEDSWPARVYLKRYVDTKRPYLMCTRYAHLKQMRPSECMASCAVATRSRENPGDVLHDLTIRDFLGSLTPGLEHHLDAFVQLGIKDQETLHAFLSWPQYIQMQFLDEGNEVLQLTSLERKALLVGSGFLAQRALQESLAEIVKPGNVWL